MSYVRNCDVWAEMARRKLAFHRDEDWHTIRLWGLFKWGEIKRFLFSGELLTDMKKENVTIWVRPSEAAYHAHIEPLLAKLDEGKGNEP